MNFATIKEADQSLGTDEMGRPAAVGRLTDAAVNPGSRAPAVGGKHVRPVGGSVNDADKRHASEGGVGLTVWHHPD